MRSLRGEGRTLVSEDRGAEPVWTRDGQLLYLEQRGDSTRVFGVRLADDTPPRVLVRELGVDHLRAQPVSNHANWDVTPDGRMVFVEPVAEQALTLIFDWKPRTEGAR